MHDDQAWMMANLATIPNEGLLALIGALRSDIRKVRRAGRPVGALLNLLDGAREILAARRAA